MKVPEISVRDFGYIGKVLGDVGYQAKGKAPVAGTPQFKGYRKLNNVPEFMYSIGDVNFTLKVSPGKKAGEAVCHYRRCSKWLDFKFQ